MTKNATMAMIPKDENEDNNDNDHQVRAPMTTVVAISILSTIMVGAVVVVMAVW